MPPAGMRRASAEQRQEAANELVSCFAFWALPATCRPACAAHLVTYFNVYLSESASRIQQPATRTRATPPTKPIPHHTQRPHAPQPQAHLLRHSFAVCVCAARHASSVAALQGRGAWRISCSTWLKCQASSVCDASKQAERSLLKIKTHVKK